MIPPLVVHCVNEIEQRGLHEVSTMALVNVSNTCFVVVVGLLMFLFFA